MEPWMLILLLPVAWMGYSFYKGYRSPAQLKSMAEALADGGTLIDVRTPAEFSQGHPAKARNIPLGELRAKAFELDPDQPVVLYCRSGARSGQALAMLRSAGFTRVMDLGPYGNAEKLPKIHPAKGEAEDKPKAPTTRNQRKRQRRRAGG